LKRYSIRASLCLSLTHLSAVGSRPRLATAATLLQLEGATRGITVSQLSPAERARHRLFVRLGRKAS
jgi:hypothetical protein